MIPANTDRPPIVWPLADLFDALRRGGFQLRPDDYVMIVQVLDAFQPKSYNDLRALMAPLLVSSEEEQEMFDRIFDAVQQKNALDPLVRSGPVRSWPWPLLLVLLTLLGSMAYVAFLWPGPVFKTDIHTAGKVGPVAVGDTLIFAVDSSMIRAAGPMARWQWETPLGTLYPHPNEPTLRIVPRQVGPLVVNLRSQRGRGLLMTSWADSLRGIEYPICDTLPVIQLDSVRLPTAPGTIRYRFTARLVGSLKNVQLTQWQLNGGVVSTNRNEWEHTFQSGTVPAFYDLRAVAFRDTSQHLCFGEARLEIGVPALNEPPFTIDVRSTGALIIPDTRVSDGYRWAIGIASILLTVLVGLYIWLYRRDGQRRTDDNRQPDSAHPLARFDSDEPPLELPLENRETELVTRDQSFYQLVRSMRQPSEGEIRRLHIARTVQSTMHEGGFPTLVFQPQLAEKEYLFLIDRSQVRSQQVALFEYLYRAFLQENVCVERFYFHQRFDAFTNETHPKGLNLRQLADAFRTHTLLIWSDGYPLLYPPYPVVEPAIRDALADWPFLAIMTPVPFIDWGAKERALQSDFRLLPADVAGQLRLLQALAEPQTRQEAYLQQHPAAMYSREDINFRQVDELRNYLGDELFQWLAALAVYPRIRWEVVLEIGRALMPAGAVNFTNLLKLARIDWMQEGTFPDRTRLELLKVLQPEPEAAARQTILKMLRYAEQYFPGSHFYDGEKFLLQTVNQFVLYAYDPEKYALYQPAQQAFRNLYEQGLYPDGAMLRYLENPAGEWPTLLPGKRGGIPKKVAESVSYPPESQRTSLREYIASLPEELPAEPVKPPLDWRRRYLYAGTGAVLLGLLGLLYMAFRPENKAIDWDQTIPVTLVFDTTACITALNTSVTDDPRWTVTLDDSLFSITNLHATRSMPLRNSIVLDNDMTQDSATLRTVLTIRDSTAGGQQQSRTVQFSRDTLRVRVNCQQPLSLSTNTSKAASPLRVSVEYTNPNAPNIYAIQAFMNDLDSDNAYRLIRPLKPAVFTGSSQVRYFRQEDKDKATTLATLASKAIGIPINTQLTKDLRSPLTHLEVWINNSETINSFNCQTVPLSWINQFNNWQSSATDSTAIGIVGKQLRITSRSSAGLGYGYSAGGTTVTGTIQGICQQRGVYLVRLGNKTNQALLIRNVTRASCSLAVVRLTPALLNGPQGQVYADKLLKTARFQRYTVPLPPQKQPLYNQTAQQDPVSNSTFGNSGTQAALSSTDYLRIRVQDSTNSTTTAGIRAYQRGQYAEAVNLYNQSLAKNPNNAYVLDLKGYALFKLKQYGQAVNALLTATKADPNYAWAYFDLARVYCAMGRSAEAAAAVRQATSLRADMQAIIQNDREFMELCGATGATAR